MTRMPAPSARMKPSRSRSNGRLAPAGSSLRVDRARIAAKPPRPMWVIAASLPPVIITSAWPSWMILKASPMALAAEAQAVATAEFGPRSPQRIEIWPLAALTISLGMVNGLIRDGPLVIIAECWVSNSLSPPMPDPMITPQEWGGRGSNAIPASSTADRLAAMANCAKRSRWRASFPPNRATGSQPCTCPPKWTLNSVVSKSVSVLTPLRPAQSADQNWSSVSPRAVTTPIPVMTTRRGVPMLLRVFLDVLDSLPDGLDLLRFFVGDGDVELFLELHHELDGIERVGPEVVDEGGIPGHLI